MPNGIPTKHIPKIKLNLNQERENLYHHIGRKLTRKLSSRDQASAKLHSRLEAYRVAFAWRKVSVASSAQLNAFHN